MNDCLYGMIGCNGKCKCYKYLSMNSTEGRKKMEEYKEEVELALKPVKEKYLKGLIV